MNEDMRVKSPEEKVGLVISNQVEAVVKVAKDSSISSVSGAIAAGLRQLGRLEIRAVGNEAIGRAVKALTLAEGYLTEEGVELQYTVGFFAVRGEGLPEPKGIALKVRVGRGLNAL